MERHLKFAPGQKAIVNLIPIKSQECKARWLFRLAFLANENIILLRNHERLFAYPKNQPRR
jgi:hypothetical protein